MQTLCDRDQLAMAANSVQRAVSPRNPLPILGSILLEASGDTLSLTATDLELTIRTEVAAQVFSAGRVALPARYFVELVRRLPDGTVELFKEEGQGEKIRLRYPRAEVELNGFDPDQFPLLPGPAAGVSFTLGAGLFKETISKVGIAVSHDDSRKVFTGIFLELSEEGFNLVATDTHRLAWKKVRCQREGKEGLCVLVPGRSLQEVSRLLGSQEENLEVLVGDTQISFRVGGTVITSRLIDGQFPNYAQLIPGSYETRVRVGAKEFMEAAERVALLSQEEARIRSNIVKLEVGQDNLSISSFSSEVGRIREEVPVTTEGEGKEINFNARYLLDVLKVLDEGEVYLELGGQRSPGVFRPVGGEEYLCLVLPIRLTGTPAV